MNLLRRFFHKPISTNEAGRLGAAVTNSKRKAPILAKARAMREAKGLPPLAILEGW